MTTSIICISETALQETSKSILTHNQPTFRDPQLSGYHGMYFLKCLCLGKISVLCGSINDFLFLQRLVDSNENDPATNFVSDAIFHSYPTIPWASEWCYIYNKRALSCFCCRLANELCALNTAPKLKYQKWKYIFHAKRTTKWRQTLL